jgi:hypothetical protein
MRAFLVTATLLTFAVLAQTEPALACACCTESGQRLDSTGPIESYTLGELTQVRFSETAALFSGPGFPDDIEGIANPSSAPYRVRGVIRAGGIVLDLTDAGGRAGRIAFAMPRQITRFEVDPRSNEPAPNNGPALYKEWRLTGNARLSGIVSAHGANAKATLILHGAGNSCTSAYDFGQWTLTVAAKGIAFTLLGQLRR